MKLILENWSSFLNEDREEISEHNYNFMLNLYNNYISRHLGGPNYEDFWNRFLTKRGLRGDRRQIPITIAGAAYSIPQLTQTKIKRLLGAGTQGIVFELDNGHALKIYEESYRDDQEGFYDSESGKMFSGQGKIMTLPIFDRGETESGLKYAEMAKVLPFNLFLKRTGRESGPYVLENLFTQLERVGKYALQMKEDPSNLPSKRNYDYYLDLFRKEAKEHDITNEEMEAMKDMVEYAVLNYGQDYTEDLFEKNFGVLEQTMSSAKPVFVLFDP
jgi:hypothetical protein